jgi:predicted  nucleic acid-binding Zn-ribbon protein
MTAATQIDEGQRVSAAQLSQRVSKLHDERERLAQQTSLARDVLADLRARLVTGDATLGDVAVAQAKTSALEGALSDADDALGRLRAALLQEEQREEAEATAARLKALHDERDEMQKQFNAATCELDEACERVAERLRSFNRRYAEASKEIMELVRQGGNSRLAEKYTRDGGCAWPRLRFGEQIAIVLTVYGQQEARREEKQRAALRATRR